MQDIKISRLHLQRVACFADLELSFHHQSIFTIAGDVGTGKSSILESMYFALTGLSLKTSGTSLGNLIQQPHDNGYIELELMVNDKPLVIKRNLKVNRNKRFSKKSIVQYNNQEFRKEGEIKAFLQKVIPLNNEQLKFLMFL